MGTPDPDETPDTPETPHDAEAAVLGADLGPASADRGVPGHDLARASARRAQAVRDRLAGMSYDEIAERHHYSDRSSARRAVMGALDRVEAKQVADLRDVENARLDLITLAMTPILVDGRQPATARVSAATVLLRTSERRSRLNGLDAPVRVQVSDGAMAMLEDALREVREAFGDVVPGEVTDQRAAE